MSVRSYVCPGEAQPISRSVHLARLAADYAKCSACPHCHDVGGIGLPPRPPRVETPLVPVLQRERLWRSLRYADARHEILAHCEALACLLWRGTPHELPVNDWDGTEARMQPGPEICVAWQSTDIAEAFATDVIRVMSRSGCRVVSLSAVTRPALEFAVDHLDCTAGLWIEGGESPAGIGFRIIGPRSSAWSEGGGLDAIAETRKRGASRPSRLAGGTKSFDILPAYRESLIRHYGPGAADLATAGWTDPLRTAWAGLEERVACRLAEACPDARCDDSPSPTVVRSLHEAVVRQRLGGGVLFGSDGRQAWFVDRREGLLSDRVVAQFIASQLRLERGERELRVVAPEELMWTELHAPGVRLVSCGAGEEQLVSAMEQSRAALGCDGAGRYWIARPTPRCDSLQTLAYLARSAEGSCIGTARAA